jgi:UDP-glucose-4-epimerase GalE
MSKIVLVTGASGYIGGQTMLNLKDAGYMVVGVDTAAPPDNLRGLPDRFYQEDFSKSHGLQLLDQFSPWAIVHCAGSSLVGPSLGRPADYYNNNFVKTKTLLDRVVDHKIDTRIIFSSSAACYGEPVMVPCAEVDPCEPISPYGQSKLMIEWMMQSYSRAYNLDYMAFRYFNACGADSQARHGQRSGATHIIARVLESIRDDREFVLNGDDYPTEDGTCIRDYVHVEDIAAAHVQAMDRSLPAGVYNLGTKQGASNREIIQLAQEITGRTVKFSVGPRRAGDPAVLTASADRWTETAKWRPQWTIRDMISHAWAWYRR